MVVRLNYYSKHSERLCTKTLSINYGGNYRIMSLFISCSDVYISPDPLLLVCNG